MLFAHHIHSYVSNFLGDIALARFVSNIIVYMPRHVIHKIHKSVETDDNSSNFPVYDHLARQIFMYSQHMPHTIINFLDKSH